MRNLINIALLFFTITTFAQVKDLKVTETVIEHRAKGYPLNVLDEVPMVKGCESLEGNKRLSIKCMNDQVNFIFAPFMKGADKVSKAKGVRVYIEFVIQSDGTISPAERVKISEQDLDLFSREAFEKFREKVNKEKLFIKPGRVYNRDVNTLYAVKYMTAFDRGED